MKKTSPDTDGLQLKLIGSSQHKENDEALLIIKGYLTANDNTPEDHERWKSFIRAAGWKGSIYHVWWNASTGLAVALETFFPIIMSSGPIPSRDLISLILPGNPGSIMALLFHWKKIRNRAEEIGKNGMNSILRKVSKSRITLLGHSLGSLVIYHTLKNLAPEMNVENAILIGGAVRQDSNMGWDDVSSNLSGRLINVFSNNDAVLKYLYRIGELKINNPCGLKPIEEKHPCIKNIDVSNLINGIDHGKYIDYLPEIIGQLWEQKKGKYCPKCNLPLHPDALTCPLCHDKAVKNSKGKERMCPKCNVPLLKEAKTCPLCKGPAIEKEGYFRKAS